MQLLAKPDHPEIDQLTMKMIVGIIAISIAFVPAAVSDPNLKEPLTSISETYFAGDWSRSFFVGFLYTISAFLLCYNGQTTMHMVLSKLAALASFCVAMFPCKCGHGSEIIPYVHYASAAVMFFVLAYFCLEFYRHATIKGHKQARWRAGIYLACFWVLALSMAALVVDSVSGALSTPWPRFVYYGEMTGLLAFGVCWLVASHVFPVLTAPGERHSVFFKANPSEELLTESSPKTTEH